MYNKNVITLTKEGVEDIILDLINAKLIQPDKNGRFNINNLLSITSNMEENKIPTCNCNNFIHRQTLVNDLNVVLNDHGIDVGIIEQYGNDDYMPTNEN